MAQKIKAATVLKNEKIHKLLLLVTLFIGNSIVNISHATTLKVCYDQWPPMTIFPSEASSARGFVIDILHEIYTSKGYKIEYYEVPLARGLDMVANGDCDMLPEYLFSKNSEKDFEYATQATFSYTAAFIVRHDDPWIYNGVKSIKGKRIATGPGWDYSSLSVDYQNYITNLNNASFVEVLSGNDDVVERILHMIKESRVDLYADNILVLQYVMNRLNLNDELKIVQPGLEKKMVEMPIFSKKIPTTKRQELIKIWNEGRLSIKGKKEEMFINKYNVTF
ncbi:MULTISPECIES: ABC transporter substrate-binding protein [unclassified Colwellia]|uniref:substrate-binding periplasmic protein n=2 Tax=unclassified Colwellia TaxID=196834 RepID=UPI0015F422C7|nr:MULTISPECIES: transporter substrate-binding domain-containing protein [unclassified Colwellia]MBA6349705.1 transporter substrate-binding domain-containing protein [Colwellia sp. BRX8-9]MBA6380410.1 transporter substrate-binding domain-containing protein [Colwellia sp. BRX10-7]MBA6387808.1 transporter substrate-binding domain-containing protein [Colwellia sp. BRX10-2]MBA6402777.1 transporter substrate-binding domain-containing protein [Colwellia sp. BRX10-5]MBA6406862.1 transporter substrate